MHGERKKLSRAFSFLRRERHGERRNQIGNSCCGGQRSRRERRNMWEIIGRWKKAKILSRSDAGK